MGNESKNLFPPKKLLLIGGATCAGIGFFLYRRHYENGELTKIDLFATLFGLVLVTVITTVMMHIARKD